ncbi:MAG: type III-A CRISPR-associated protein Cas10/Csm1, partial [candidate division WOR-3 bacterium]
MNEQNDRDYQTVVLAALLHDIGKFWHRTGRHPDRTHPELSAWFVREHLGEQWKDVEDTVNYHHLPSASSAPKPRLALTVALADWLSSGERRELPEGERGTPAEDPLISIFSQLFGSQRLTHYPLAPLSDDGRLEPKPDVAVSREDYARLWDSFKDESQRLPKEDFPLLTDQLLALLEKFTLFIPSAVWRSRTDISLYHHLKLTAAIAACLYKDQLTSATISDLLNVFGTDQGADQVVAYLLGGDISGIQDFIYNLRYEQALKGLRGRSLYLQLISEAIAAGILQKFGLPRTNIIYCGGGHFYLLIPAVADAQHQLDGINAHVDQTLLTAHRGRLGVTIALQELTTLDFKQERFGTAWDRLHEKLARAKKRRFASLLKTQQIKAVLGPTGAGGEEPACSVCGEETSGKDDQGKPLCPLCSSLAELGRSLRSAKSLLQQPATGQVSAQPKWFEVLAALGQEYRFVTEPDGAAAFVLNTTDLADGARGFRFIAKHVPTVNSETAELSDIIKHAQGIKHWGVLRADVDRLGETFKTGLGANRSISRLSMLSYLLSYFFSARVQAIAQEEDYKESIYLAYSGGDDLFVIGPWSLLPGFAERIRNEFRSFASERMDISAGIFLAPSEKFPVYEAADLAGEEEAKSKAAGRSRLTFLGRTLHWRDLPCVREAKAELAGLLEAGLPRAIL